MSPELDFVRSALDRVSAPLRIADVDTAQVLVDAEDALLDLEAHLVVRPLGSALLPLVAGPARARAERLVRHLHGLGPRAMGELLDALACRHDLADEIRAELEAFGRLTPERVAATGGREFAAGPLRKVPR